MSALMAWNADQTRMPARMHSQYLHGLYLENRLTSGRYAVEGRKIALRDIRAPIFVVGMARDHIAPWRSVYKICLFTDTDVTFALASGGHNVGIVNPPTRSAAPIQLMTMERSERYVEPDTWVAAAPSYQGSWWPAWEAWLRRAGSGDESPRRRMGATEAGLPPLCDAPGSYVRGRGHRRPPGPEFETCQQVAANLVSFGHRKPATGRRPPPPPPSAVSFPVPARSAGEESAGASGSEMETFQRFAPASGSLSIPGRFFPTSSRACRRTLEGTNVAASSRSTASRVVDASCETRSAETRRAPPPSNGRQRCALGGVRHEALASDENEDRTRASGRQGFVALFRAEPRRKRPRPKPRGNWRLLFALSLKPPQTAIGAGMSQFNPPVVLVVEDEPLTLFHAVELVTDAGFEAVSERTRTRR